MRKTITLLGALVLMLLAGWSGGTAQAQDYRAAIHCGEITQNMLARVEVDHVYELTMNAGQTATITMTAIDTELDPYLVIYDFYPSQNPLAYDDDSAGGLDAQITFTAPQAGTYYIVATRYGRETESSSGEYQLMVQCGSGNNAGGGKNGGASSGSGAQGQGFCGHHDQDAINDQQYEVLYELAMTAGQTFTATMEAINGNLDPFLYVVEQYPSETMLAYNDDRGTDYNAELTFTAPETRVYTLVATRYGRSAGLTIGSYELSISCGDVTAGGQSESSVCDQGDQENITNQQYDIVYELPLLAGQDITITMNRLNGDLDPYLLIYENYPSQNPLAYNDDNGNTYDSQLDFVAPQTRTYYLVATRYGRDTGTSTGTYDLYIGCNRGISGGNNASGGVSIGGNTALSTVLGGSFCNYSDSGTIDSQYYDRVYELTMQAGQTVTAGLYMMSNDLDPYLLVYDFYPSQNPLVYDDDSGGGLDAEVSFTAPQSGTYYLVATRYGRDTGSSSGSYQLNIGCGGSSGNAGNNGNNASGNQGSSGAALGVGQPPSFGAVALQSGFANDPYEVEIVSGGSLLASDYAAGSCAGFIASNPDFQLDYQAGQYALTMYFDTPANTEDTTLVVLAPDLSWYCDDDSGGSLQPWIKLNNPMSGQYLIWVGSFGSEMHTGSLVITERDMMPR